MASELNFKDKVVIITGASSGIGAGTAQYLGDLGATLVLVGRNYNNLCEIADIVKSHPDSPKPLKIVADVSDEADNARIIDKTLAAFGRIDVLVNNAGILVHGSIENTCMADYDDVMAINLRAVFHLTLLATPHIVASKGNIVNVSCVQGLRSFPGAIAYSMSKSAIDQFTRCAALELAPKGVRVNSVNPGVIITDFHQRAGMDPETYKKFLEYSKGTHALHRAGKVSEVAAAIAFLASDMSSFSTGLTLAVDGGKHVMSTK